MRKFRELPERGLTARPAVTAPIQLAILQVLKARGGRLWMVDLVFELRWRGATPERVYDELQALIGLGLVRGPLSALAYELTPEGYDTARLGS